MALPATDAFTRANAALNSGNWTVVSGPTNPQIVSNLVQPGVINGNDSCAFWNADAFANDQYAQTSITTLNTDTSRGGGPAVRHSASAFSLYRCLGRGPLGATAKLEIHKFVGGSFTNLSSSTKTINTTDVVKVQVVGSTITGFINGVSQISTTDSSLTSGSAGLSCFTDAGSATDVQIDNWEGGDVGTATSVIQQMNAGAMAEVGTSI